MTIYAEKPVWKDDKPFWGFIMAVLFILGMFFLSTYAEGKEMSVDSKVVKDVLGLHMKGRSGTVTQFELPPLPYGYNELEPYYDEQTLYIHHNKHHAGYVKGLNQAIEKLAEARKSGDFSLIRYWERNLAFNGSGHILHSLFWTNMSPRGGGVPKGELASQISRDFGSFDAFKGQFSSAAATVEGSGWVVLGWMPEFEGLVILQAENHQKSTLWGIKPLLVLDMWEHAYYLKFQNRKSEWIDSWWNIVNWDDVTRRFEASRP